MQIKNSTQGAWCVGGDFNVVLKAEERRSTSQSIGSDSDFCSFVDESGLIWAIWAQSLLGVEQTVKAELIVSWLRMIGWKPLECHRYSPSQI